MKRVADVGSPLDSRVVNGLVFRKNVVHKLMRTHVVQPRIMMLGSMLEYHRTTGKLSSFDTLLEQVGQPIITLHQSIAWQPMLEYLDWTQPSFIGVRPCKLSVTGSHS